jgi:hypothetical protein
MKAENRETLKKWIKICESYIDDAGKGLYPIISIKNDLQHILDNEQDEVTIAKPQGPADGESWEQYCNRKQVAETVVTINFNHDPIADESTNVADCVNLDYVET